MFLCLDRSKNFDILGYSHPSVRFHYPQLLQLYPNFSRQFIVFQVLISLTTSSTESPFIWIILLIKVGFFSIQTIFFRYNWIYKASTNRRMLKSHICHFKSYSLSIESLLAINKNSFRDISWIFCFILDYLFSFGYVLKCKY